MKIITIYLLLLRLLETTATKVTVREFIPMKGDDIERELGYSSKRYSYSKHSSSSSSSKRSSHYVRVCGYYRKRPCYDIPNTAIHAGSFNTLVTALTTAGLVGALSEPNGPFTVFAPTDKAFAALPAGLVECLLLPESKDVLTYILLYHVVDGCVYSCNLSDGQVVTTLNGEDVVVDRNYYGLEINTSCVITANILATNGVIHAIDKVLVPPSVDVGAFLASCPNMQ